MDSRSLVERPIRRHAHGHAVREGLRALTRRDRPHLNPKRLYPVNAVMLRANAFGFTVVTAGGTTVDLAGSGYVSTASTFSV